MTHSDHVEGLIADAAAEHESLLVRLPDEVRNSLPVDAQGVTAAIEYLGVAVGLSADERRELIRPHAVNPAMLHARVFGGAPLARSTVIGSFVEGARVRADALTAVADAVGDEEVGGAVRALLVARPLPIDHDGPRVVDELRAAYGAHEEAALLIAAALDERAA